MLSPSLLPRNLEAAFRDLGSEKPATRASAIHDVVRHSVGDAETRARALQPLVTALRDDAVAAVRSAAAVALADLHAGEALPALLVAVEDDDPHVRQMAIAAIGEIGDPRATQRIERALSDARPEVRYQAIIAYARVVKDDPPAVANAVARALDDDDEAIRYIAMRVAEETQGAAEAGPSGGGAAGDTDGEPLRDARIVARAALLLDGQDPAIAVVAAIYLARLGDERGRRVVFDVVAETRRTPELEDEQACVDLAGALGMRDAIVHLERRVWGRRRVLRSVLSWGAGDGASCAWHARIALARLGHERARQSILEDLRSWRRETREAAVVAAGRARLREARATLEHLGGSVDDALVREALLRLAVG